MKKIISGWVFPGIAMMLCYGLLVDLVPKIGLGILRPIVGGAIVGAFYSYAAWKGQIGK